MIHLFLMQMQLWNPESQLNLLVGLIFSRLWINIIVAANTWNIPEAKKYVLI